MTTWTVTYDLAPVQRLWRQLMRAGTNLAPAMNRVGARFVQLVRRSFQTARSPNGERWEPLKSRKGEPLRDTGRLMNSIAYIASDTGVTVGTNVKYGIFHQKGAKLRRPVNQVRAHATSGAFMSFAKAEKRKRFVRVSFSTVRQRILPARKFLPEGVLPEPWQTAIRQELVPHFKAAVGES